MKNLFPGYYPFSEAELKKLMNESTVVFGATVLLDIFRISDGDLFFSILEKNVPENRRWLPYDTAWYYHKMLPQVILDETEKVKTASMHLQKFKEMITDPRHHPYLDNNVMYIFDAFVSSVSESLANKTEMLTDNLRIGNLKKRIQEFYQGKIGEAYEEQKMEQLLNDAKYRNINQLHPCLSLSSNPDERVQANRYIIWKQILGYAKDTKKPVLLVLNRITQNWFAIYNDVVIPHPSLVNEFKTQTGVDIHIITAYDFIRYMNIENHLKEKILKQLHDKPTQGNNQQIQYVSSDQQVS